MFKISLHDNTWRYIETFQYQLNPKSPLGNIIGSDIGLFPGGTKPLSKSTLLARSCGIHLKAISQETLNMPIINWFEFEHY